ncbi:MAG: hypothetical protein KatS3mg131_0359 [Candidatus Tectimicrobiota bacterium]|nr:MAG: hypothetical protein KatS3mg131_0359 [Candidatus Tectomicrobia bacterium]
MNSSLLLAEAVAQGALSDDEAYEIAQADVIVHGRRREDGTPVYLVVEVSWGVGPTDVQRARQRAALLAKLGTPTVPVVAGARITPAARRLAQDLHVQQLTNGQVLPPA